MPLVFLLYFKDVAFLIALPYMLLLMAIPLISFLENFCLQLPNVSASSRALSADISVILKRFFVWTSVYVGVFMTLVYASLLMSSAKPKVFIIPNLGAEFTGLLVFATVALTSFYFLRLLRFTGMTLGKFAGKYSIKLLKFFIPKSFKKINIKNSSDSTKQALKRVLEKRKHSKISKMRF